MCGKYTAPSQDNDAANSRALEGSTSETDANRSSPDKRKKLLITASLFGVLAIILITIVWAFFSGDTNGVTPYDASGVSFARVFESTVSETKERTGSSPLQALIILADTLESGNINVNFDYIDSAALFGGSVSGHVAFLSDARSQNYALEAVVGLMGGMMNIDLSAHLNSERFALHSTLIGSDFYGFTFSTFREDIRRFGPLIGMDEVTMAEISDLVELFGEAMNEARGSYNSNYADYVPYINLLMEFMSGLEYTLEESDTITTINYIITHEDILIFLNDLYSVLERDSELRRTFDFYDSPLMQGNDMLTYDEFLLEMRSAIREFENSITGEVALEFSIDANDRLNNLTVSTDFEVDGMPSGIVTLTADFGLSVYDRWVLDVALGNTPLFNFAWNFSESSQGFENVMDITYSTWYGTETFTLASLWPSGDGPFTLSFAGNNLSESFSGDFSTSEGGGFLLIPNDLNLSSTETLSLKITAAPGAEITPIEFINLDRWDQSLINSLDFIFGLLF